mmetsp:Transcript_6453/g.6052  ORF Transcript_6453/g.6052 Transcript_6453/m.6052 type:complete len:154 (-) Transcript_6453:159-620(-)
MTTVYDNKNVSSISPSLIQWQNFVDVNLKSFSTCCKHVSSPIPCPAPSCLENTEIEANKDLDDLGNFYNSATWLMYYRIIVARKGKGDNSDTTLKNTSAFADFRGEEKINENDWLSSTHHYPRHECCNNHHSETKNFRKNSNDDCGSMFELEL